jgi:hypothetical protein
MGAVPLRRAAAVPVLGAIRTGNMIGGPIGSIMPRAGCGAVFNFLTEVPGVGPGNRIPAPGFADPGR